MVINVVLIIIQKQNKDYTKLALWSTPILTAGAWSFGNVNVPAALRKFLFVSSVEKFDVWATIYKDGMTLSSISTLLEYMAHDLTRMCSTCQTAARPHNTWDWLWRTLHTHRPNDSSDKCAWSLSSFPLLGGPGGLASCQEFTLWVWILHRYSPRLASS